MTGEVKKFRGGIQEGTTAYDADSRKLDSSIKEMSVKAFEILREKYPDLDFQRKLTQDEIRGGIGACEPDGGLWYYTVDGERQLITVFEAKKQQDRGNAIERWHKNHNIVRLGMKVDTSNATYVTFCSGEGAYEEGAIGKAIDFMHESRNTVSFDKLENTNAKYDYDIKPGKNIIFYSKDGYTDSFVLDAIIECVERSILALA